jgi:hypothetical protein
MSKQTAQNTTQLINRSISRKEIVHANWNTALQADRDALSDGCADHVDCLEYWGTNTDDEGWRVHLDGERDE